MVSRKDSRNISMLILYLPYIKLQAPKFDSLLSLFVCNIKKLGSYSTDYFSTIQNQQESQSESLYFYTVQLASLHKLAHRVKINSVPTLPAYGLYYSGFHWYHVAGNFCQCKFSYIRSKNPQNKFSYVIVSYGSTTRPRPYTSLSYQYVTCSAA